MCDLRHRTRRINTKLKKINTIFIAVLGVSVPLGKSAYGDERAEEWGQGFQCDKQRVAHAEACRALEQYRQGEGLEETPVQGVRFVDIGYMVTADGEYIKQLMSVELSWSRYYEKKIHFPNKLCTFVLVPENDEERMAIEDAIAALQAHNVPESNAAYQWAMESEMRPRSCRGLLTMDDNKTAPVSVTGNWSIAETKEHYVFVAKSWEGKKAEMVLMHRK